MRAVVEHQWRLLLAMILPSALAVAAAFSSRTEALGDDAAAPHPVAESRAVGYLKEVRPILAQHCFGCHGPDEAARKGKLRLDLKDTAFAERHGKHVIAPGSLDNSIAWERISSDEDSKRMPPKAKGEPLTEKQIATLKAWIEQGAKWEEHWSFQPPMKPPIPEVSDKAWVRDPLDAFVLSRLDREHLKPEGEASREVWLRRATFDLTGLPPTPAEMDEFLKDKSPDAYEKQVDRLLKSQRYGERQAQEWLDLARYADTSGYQNDTPRKIWKWREWVINAYNTNMPFDQFTIEQLAGDLLPNATLSQKVATGFNRNHPTNSEAGEEEDEYRSVYVIDRVNTTATVFMGLTLACTQCHDHKYDPLSQRDYYSFYSFFNNIKERDSDFGNPRPSIPVPNPDQEPRLNDLKTRIDALKQRLDRDDSLTDIAQKQWESKSLARLGKPIAWTTAQPSGMVSRNGSLLKALDDGSILAAGTTPVKDTYEVMLLPGKKNITALRLEVLPDDSHPEKGLGRASDGRFILSAIEIRNTTLSESQDPPLVYISRAEADINQKMKEDPAAYDMFPGSLDSAIVVEPVGGAGGEGRGFGGGWSIVDDERKKPHDAIFLPLEPLDTNEASVIRISLHHTSSGKFKSLIGRFRISYTEDNRIRELLLPAQTKLWNSIGPFPAEDVTKAFTTAFEPEKDIKHDALDLKKSYKKIVLPTAQGAGGQGGGAANKPGQGGKPATTVKPEDGAAAPGASKPEKSKPDENAALGKGTEKSESTPKPDKPADKKETTDKDFTSASSSKSEADSGKTEGPPADGKPAFKKGSGKFGKKPSDSDGSAPAASSKPDKPESEQKKDTKSEGAPEATGATSDEKKAEKADVAPAKKPSADDAKPEADKPDGKEMTEADKTKRKPEKITWAEQRKWRDGSSARLQGANSAFYLTRKIVSTRPRTATVQIDGPAGFKMWVNGEPVQTSAPPPPTARPTTAKKPETKATDDDKDSEEKKEEKPEGENIELEMPDFENIDIDQFMGRGRSKTEKKFRIGLREGENEIVLKIVYGAGGRPQGRRGFSFAAEMAEGEVAEAVMAEGGMGGGRRGGGGGSFTFNLTAKGDDVLNHEVATALRLEAMEVAKRVVQSLIAKVKPSFVLSSNSMIAAAASTGPAASHEIADTPTRVTIDEPKKVSLVGEKSAPLKSYGEENKLSPSERRQKVLRDYYRSNIDPVGRVIAEELAKLKDEEKQVKRDIPQTLVMEELDKPRQAYVFKRGLYKNRGESVSSASPAVLPPMATELPRNRLGLAQWLVSGHHPLTARVLVNRIWQQYFGIGIVRTAEDFGIRAELPTHPELLDYLATELVDSKWDLKKLHKRLVLSATYRQASTASKEKLERDPENRLLARGPRMRLTAEMIRDNALAISGLLVEKIGGESVKPVQPKDAWKTVTGNMASSYRRDRDEKQYRRGIYVYWKRGSPFPSMLNFDAVKRDSCTVTRAETTTPLQALTLLNDPAYVEFAKILGQRMLKDSEAIGRARDLKKPEEEAKRLAYGFRLCTSRLPNEQEAEVLRKLLDDQRAHFKADVKAAKKLVAVGDAKFDEKIDTAEAAAWASVGNALLNLDATIHR